MSRDLARALTARDSSATIRPFMPTAPMPTIPIPDELRLGLAILMNAAAFTGAWRFVSRRLGTSAGDRAADALLLVLLVQYLAVGIPGVLGLLTPISVAVAGFALSALLFFLPTRLKSPGNADPGQARSLGAGPGSEAASTPADRYVLPGCLLFAAGYLAAPIEMQRLLPVMANDAITYHFPAAVHWLQAGRLSLYEAWFFNPANTYSPLAGSMFITWYLAPLGNDVIAKFVQVAAVPLLFFSMLRLVRALGLRTGLAGLIALAVVLSKPVVRQSFIEKDDLYLTALFTAAVAACATRRLADPLGPWRLGAALGLMLAVKFTALLALPVLLLLADAPFRANWRPRDWAVALAIPLLLAGPWYVRNAVLTGNPLYPVDVRLFGHTLFPGLFSSPRSSELTHPSSVWVVLTGRDQSLPAAPLLLALAGCVAASIRVRRLRRDPLARVCVLGPVVALAVFVIGSPHPEARYFFPGYVLMFAACALAIADWLGGPRVPAAAHWGAAGTLLAASVLTSLTPHAVIYAGTMALLPTLLGLLCLGFYRSAGTHLRSVLLRYGAVLGLVAFALWLYVEWHAYVTQVRSSANDAYALEYAQAHAWRFVRDEIPPTEPLAYANTFLVLPMTGFEHARPLIYVPTRRGIRHLHDLPRLSDHAIPGEEVVPRTAAALSRDTDAEGWLRQLLASPATHVIVFHSGPGVPNPPELRIIAEHPAPFTRVYSDPQATVFRIVRSH